MGYRMFSQEELLFVDSTFAARRRGKEQQAEDAAHWVYHSLSGRGKSQFLRYLLNWAAMPYADENQDRVLRLLYLPDWVSGKPHMTNVLRKVLNGNDVERIHAGLESIEQSVAPKAPIAPRKMRL
jgi:hypothetical protein